MFSIRLARGYRLGATGGLHLTDVTDSIIWFPLCLMKMLAFVMQVNKFNQICNYITGVVRAQATIFHHIIHR